MKKESIVQSSGINEEDLIYRLRKRAEIRRQIPTRKSVQEGKSDRLADLLEEAAVEIERLRESEIALKWYKDINDKEWSK